MKPAKRIVVNGHKYILASEVPAERVEKGGLKILIPSMSHPVTLYKEQWASLLGMKNEILDGIKSSQDKYYAVKIPGMRFPVKLPVVAWQKLFEMEDEIRQKLL